MDGIGGRLTLALDTRRVRNAVLMLLEDDTPLTAAEEAMLAQAMREALADAGGELSDPNVRQLGPFVRDSETSRKAAIAAYPKQGTQRWRILHALAGAQSTRDELAARTGLSPNSVRPRVAELVEGGWICETDATRKTDAGQDAAVLALTEKGERELREREAA